MGRKSTYVCAGCRTTASSNAGHRSCQHCGAPMRCMGPNWRAPRRSDDRAWAMVAAGGWVTELPQPARGLPPYAASHLTSPSRWPRRTPRRDPVRALDGAVAGLGLGDAPTDQVVAELVEHASSPHVEVRRALVEEPKVPWSVVGLLLTDSDPSVRAAAVCHPSLDASTTEGVAALRRAGRDRAPEVRLALAGRNELPGRLLRTLAGDSDRRVARRAAAHPELAAEALLPVLLADIPSARLGDVASLHALRGGTAPVDAVRRLLETMRENTLTFQPAPSRRRPTLTVRQALGLVDGILM